MRKTIWIEPKLFELIENLRRGEHPIPSFSQMFSRLAYRGSIGYSQPIIPLDREAHRIVYCDSCGRQLEKMEGLKFCDVCGRELFLVL